jgi:hypothetical protein
LYFIGYSAETAKRYAVSAAKPGHCRRLHINGQRVVLLTEFSLLFGIAYDVGGGQEPAPMYRRAHFAHRPGCRPAVVFLVKNFGGKDHVANLATGLQRPRKAGGENEQRLVCLVAEGGLVEQPMQGGFRAGGADTGFQHEHRLLNRTAQAGRARAAGNAFQRAERPEKKVGLATEREENTRNIQVGFSKTRVAATRQQSE